jgi:hypothetical protein
MSTLSTTNLKNPSSGSNNIVLNVDGTTTITAPSNIIKSGTAVASTSGTSIDFTGIPSWVKRITVMFNGVSTNGTSLPQIQIGSGSVDTTGYVSVVSSFGAGVAANSTTGLLANAAGNAAYVLTGLVTISALGSNLWIGSTVTTTDPASGNFTNSGAGRKTLSGTLDRLRITTVNGTDTFDAGSINILYEG